ncbi:MAG: MmgE/PrpD family protein [Rhodobacteraceae bacterium]|nr:MmgE/PrpD family protein [Paracoccaceae bacterium]
MDHLSELAAFVATATPASDVLGKTALILADSIGAIVGGAAEPEVAALTERQCAGVPGIAQVIGTARTAAPQTAAFLNGTAGTTLEMDEGNQFCKGHPGMHVIPAVLAAAAGRDLPGAALLSAIAVGYEAAARVGIATALRPSMHPHGTWGAIGAVAGVMRLGGAEAGAIRNAMNMAANLGLSTSRRTMLEGGTVRNTFAGVSNQMGLLAADLAASGYSGDSDGVGHVFGKVVSDSFEPAALTDALGSRWEVMRNYFKMHSCCRYNHATLDALAAIRTGNPDLRAEDVDRVTVETYNLAVELADPAPKNVLAAKFSVPFAVATVLVHGSSGVESFASGTVSEPATRALAARVEVREDPSMSAQLPDKRPARVTVTLKDGRRLTAATQTNRGDWADPYPPEDIHAKYLSLTQRLWSRGLAEDVWARCHALAQTGDAGPFLKAMAT